jgi:hypothetical protein
MPIQKPVAAPKITQSVKLISGFIDQDLRHPAKGIRSVVRVLYILVVFIHEWLGAHFSRKKMILIKVAIDSPRDRLTIAISRCFIVRLVLRGEDVYLRGSQGKQQENLDCDKYGVIHFPSLSFWISSRR